MFEWKSGEQTKYWEQISFHVCLCCKAIFFSFSVVVEIREIQSNQDFEIGDITVAVVVAVAIAVVIAIWIFSQTRL